ncbi:MAG: DNA polymerase III subunit gamma/tau [Clostridia bacterium]|nr:DNA polymerase III subunit gamma/tau [Clostridia bacterium]
MAEGYQALYRKYRPKTFDEVVGQDHIVNTLKNQIETNKIGHAYLFCGIRGTGKTTLAKILGKTVNCSHLENGNPCLKCDECLGIEDGSLLNVIEMDAASNNGVDYVRMLKEDVRYMPASGKYKVYIIDEVHMLSGAAFNALLKTLEEPPAHVIFVLATTDVQKLPVTILSRCQRFDLRRITKPVMKEFLKKVLDREGKKLTDDALDYIASLSEGSMRDALSLLEQVISASRSDETNLDDILDTLGNVSYDTYSKFTLALNNKNIKEAIEIINQVHDEGKDMNSFINLYSTYLRNLVLISSNADESMLDMSRENIENLKSVAKSVPVNKLVSLLEHYMRVQKEIKYDMLPKLKVEVETIRLCRDEQMVEMPQTERALRRDEVPAVPTNEKLENADKIQAEILNTKVERRQIAGKIETLDAGDLDGLRCAWNIICESISEMPRRVRYQQVEIYAFEGNTAYFKTDSDKTYEEILGVKARLEQNALPKVNGANITIDLKLEGARVDSPKKVRPQRPELDAKTLEALNDLDKNLNKRGIDHSIQ